MEEMIMSENNMTRTSKDMYYLKIAETVLERSTCLRRRYGAVIVNNDEIVSTGYNGAPRGEQNCIDCGYCYREANNIPKGERYEMCMSGNTVVKLLNGEYKTLKEIAELGMTDFWVYSIDVNTGTIVPAIAKLSRITGYAKKLLKVTFDNGRSLLCTPDHKFLMRDCTYKQAENLEYGDSVMPMYYNFARNSVGGNGYESVCNTISMRQGRLEVGDKYKTILKHFDSLEDALDLARHYNHKVVSIEEIDYNDYVYDLYVPEFNNFAVDLGDNSCVFVHNCVAVHAEQNAIISASRKEMLGATIYIVGKEVSTGGYANPAPCLICRRMIRNAGITKCIGLVDGEPKEISLEI